MTSTTELGEFLRVRRAQLRPDDLGVVSYGARRVPGLRREELAQLAGVSPTYYTRLEQGQSQNASDAVLDAVATALRLTPEERRHLHTLARPPAGPAQVHTKPDRPGRPDSGADRATHPASAPRPPRRSAPPTSARRDDPGPGEILRDDRPP
jgi:transcriptional regulator with XRE-family HTH domain